MNEEELLRKIEKLSRPTGAKWAGARHANGLRLGIGDDTAIWAPTPGFEMILTSDWSLEGSHFLLDKHPADAIGWKAMGRATSDIAAMGGIPRCFLLNLALPPKLTGRWLTGFLRGLKRATAKFGCTLAGGDTTRRDQVLINIAVIGEVRTGQAVLRSGAHTGDALFVSGTLGEADLGLRQLQRAKGLARPTTAALRKHMYPEPRLALGRWLADRQLATAMMDISDGLSTDLARLCAASGKAATVEAAALPRITPDGADALRLALHGGDDYELLFTVRATDAHRMPKSHRGLRLTRIGTIQKGKGVMVRWADGRIEALRPGGWDPFRK
jgi:thiamine-monophosphate kinase